MGHQSSIWGWFTPIKMTILGMVNHHGFTFIFMDLPARAALRHHSGRCLSGGGLFKSGAGDGKWMVGGGGFMFVFHGVFLWEISPPQGGL